MFRTFQLSNWGKVYFTCTTQHW